jgi:hypothetical protein
MLEWVPSATWPRSITTLRVYIRWGKTDLRFGWKVERPSSQVTILKFPDRVLYMCWQPQDYPKDVEYYDEVVDFSPYEKGTLGRRMMSSILISAHNAHDPTAIRDMERSRPGSVMGDMSTWNHSGLEVMGDSGGAQLYSGKIHHIDPNHVINYYNKGVSVGMALDIPPREADQSSDRVLRLCALAQAKSNAVYQAKRAEDLKLFNVVHGFDLQQTRDYIKTVVGANGEFSGWDGWGVGSGSWLEPSLLRNCVTVLKEAPWPTRTFDSKEAAATQAPWLTTQSRTVKRGPKAGQKVYRRPYQHLHLFAVSGPSRLPYYAWLGKHVDRFTVDSTQWLQGIIYNRYLALMPNGRLITYPFGRERNKQEYLDLGTAPVDNTPLPCACPVCRILPTWEPFRLEAKYRLYTLLGLHNIWTTNRMTQMWANNAEEMDAEQYRDEVAYVNGPEAHFTLDFIDRVVNGDIDEANESEKMLFAFEKTGSQGQVNNILPGAIDENPDDPVSLLGKTNMLLGDKAPSLIKTTLPNYLTREEIEAEGLRYYPVTKGRKRRTQKKKPRKRYVYAQHSKKDYEKAIVAWLATPEGQAFSGCDIAFQLKRKDKEPQDMTLHVGPEDVVATLKNLPARRAFVKLNKIPMPKLVKKGEVQLITDEEHAAARALKHQRQSSRYRRRRKKRPGLNKKKRKPKAPAKKTP